jgi:hypothetical protein
VQVSSLTALNERLTHMAKDLSSQACSLQASLDRAAAERKSLEAAAALEVQRAKSSSALLLLGGNAQSNADATQRVVGEVEALSKGQQQLVGLLQELREDLLGLVAQGEAGQQAVQAGQPGGAVQLGEAVQAGGTVQAAKACGPVQDGEAAQTSEAVQLGQAVQTCGAVQTGEAAQASEAVEAVEAADRVLVGECIAAQDSSTADSSSSTVHVHGQVPAGCVRVASVRGGVDAALAATVSGALEL